MNNPNYQPLPQQYPQNYSYYYQPHQPWQQPYPLQWQPYPQRQAKTGAAKTALILGIIALALSPIPFLNNASLILGLIGMGFAINGLTGTSKPPAGLGLIFSIAGITVALLFQLAWSNQLYG